MLHPNSISLQLRLHSIQKLDGGHFWKFQTGTTPLFSQALYFSYGFGAFVSPLIAEPFLSGSPHPDLGLPAAKRGNPLPYGGMGHRSHHKLSHRPTNHMRDTFSTGSEEYKSEVQVAYWIIALAHVSLVA